jgi:glycosyltransferase involved in cell wall biosynthesis
VRAVVVAFQTYGQPSGRGKLRELAQRVDDLLVVGGRIKSYWPDSDVVPTSYQLELLDVTHAMSVAGAGLQGLNTVIRSFEPDLVHVEAEPWQYLVRQSFGAVWDADAARGVQFYENGPRMHGVSGALRRRLAATNLRQSDYFLAASRAGLDWARTETASTPCGVVPISGVGEVRDRTAGNHSSTRWFRPGTADLRVSYAGRLEPEKGIRDAVAACSAAVERVPLQFVIMGRGRLEKFVRQAADKYPWLSFAPAGSRSDVLELFADSDVSLMPSRTTKQWSEQFGRAAIESMSVGTPVLAYRSGALPEVLNNGGVLVDEGDRRGLERELILFANAGQAGRTTGRTRAVLGASEYLDARIADSLVALWCSAIATRPVSSRHV